MEEENKNTEEITPIKKKEKRLKLKKIRESGTSFWTEFKAFINRGNVVNLAVALVMGTAFTAIVNSLVNNLIMPVVGIIFGKTDIGELKWVVSDNLTFEYGKFILAVMNFLFIALFLFIVLRVFLRVSKLKEKFKKQNSEEQTPAEPVPEPETTEDILKDIRALLLENKDKANNELKE